MAGQRRRSFTYAVVGLVLAWTLALAGYEIAKASKVTPDKVMAYASTIDLQSLSPQERTNRLRKLAKYLNALSLDERRSLPSDTNLFNEMTDDEKEWFLETTMPVEIQQSLAQFESLPPDARQRMIDGAMRSLQAQDQANGGTNGPGPVLSPELEAKIRTLGLKTFYSESSAQTKAELAPLLNQLQMQMENGRMFRRGGPGPGGGG